MASPGPHGPQVPPGTYNNPLNIQIPNDGRVESCADPSIIHSQTPGGTVWTERAITYQVLSLIVIVSDPVGDFRGTSAPLESFTSHGGRSTGWDA